MGVKDVAYEKQGAVDWSALAAKFSRLSKQTLEYDYLFKAMQKLCKTLSYKAGLGIKIRKAYKSKDRELLREAADDCGKAIFNLNAFHRSFYDLWHRENKPFGWEIQDARLGGLRARLATCQKRLCMYQFGLLEKLDELEEELLPVKENETVSLNNYAATISWNNF